MIEKFKNYALYGAVHENDVKLARELLTKHGADVNYRYKSKESHYLITACCNHLRDVMLKLLVENGAILDCLQIFFLFNTSGDFIKKVVPHIIMHNRNKKTVLQSICYFTLDRKCRLRESRLDILKLLLDYGLPINDYLMDHNRFYTPFHICLLNNEENFVRNIYIFFKIHYHTVSSVKNIYIRK